MTYPYWCRGCKVLYPVSNYTEDGICNNCGTKRHNPIYRPRASVKSSRNGINFKRYIDIGDLSYHGLLQYYYDNPGFAANWVFPIDVTQFHAYSKRRTESGRVSPTKSQRDPGLLREAFLDSPHADAIIIVDPLSIKCNASKDDSVRGYPR